MEQRAYAGPTSPGGGSTDREHTAAADFTTALARYRAWCDDLAVAIADYQSWIEQQGQLDGEQDLRVYELIDALKDERLTIALVGEVSRGKTELLNALFFSNFKQRLLPSAAGRTTMCPTELRYDDGSAASVKLLPIETRKTAMSIAEYRSTPVHWTTLHILKVDSVEEVREAFLEVTRTKKVSAWEAKELGLYTEPADGVRPSASTTVEIPVWRHAIINFPHPLLRRGLVVLDTPGLNAIGAEPELTYKMLPEAHAVLFVLAADAGVTRSDMEVWTKHVAGARGINASGRFVILNKIDVLWDELQDEARIKATITRQIRETARTLGVDEKSLFALSAQKALAGRAKGDDAMLARSGVLPLEQRITDKILPQKYDLIRNKVVAEISSRVRDSHALLEARLATADKQLNDLRQLGVKNREAIQKMVARMREEKLRYDQELKGFDVTRGKLGIEAKVLLTPMSLTSLDTLIKETRIDMQESWTTNGLQQSMKTFFGGTRSRMDEVAKRAESLKREVEAIYKRLNTEFGFTQLHPVPLSLSPYLIEFMRLEERAEEFRNSPFTVMTEQRYVVKKFFISLVSQARVLFAECNNTAKAWFQALVTPLYTQLQDHKAAIDAQLEMLRKIHKNMDNLGVHIADLEAVRVDLAGQLKRLDSLLQRIQNPPS
jgi:hypothetical protein